jgi:carbamoyltransferase
VRDTILGINCTLQPDGSYSFEGNVAVVRRNRPLFAISQERVTRRRYDGGFRDALAYALERTGTNLADVEAVAVSGFGQPTEGDPEGRAQIRAAVEEATGGRVPFVFVSSHHEAHAAGAAATSGFTEALVAVVDGDGSIIGPRRAPMLFANSMERTSFYALRGGSMSLVERDHDGVGEVGFGKAYARVTRYLGFQSYHHAGKTMGLAPFGDPGRLAAFPLFEPDGAGRFRTTMRSSEDGQADLRRWFESRGFRLPERRDAGDLIRRIDMDVARWIQEQIEHAVVSRVLHLAARERLSRVCGTGGVFLNSVMNRKLEDALGPGRLFVPPSPGDAGLALGAAAHYLWKCDGRLPEWPAVSSLGGAYDNEEIGEAIGRLGDGVRATRCDDVSRAAAEALSRGKVVAWFQGPSEYGPRALGHRSLLADPRSPWTKEILNHQVKRREWFRPYAPAVLAQRCGDYFDAPSEVPFMMSVANARSRALAEIPSSIHVDRTARLQTVSRERSPLFAALLDEFCALTGVPVVLNTSFNLAGMPIVERPEDALGCFLQADGVDLLAIGDYLVVRG